ncbi:hypothetical protein MKX03_029276 [Papaver bracteatum]|nr:hypothetical protein MKX03_029276 [Papaver bracteatum]
MVGLGNKTLALYYVSLEGISVGSTRLNIPQGTFKISETGYGGVVIDTGSTNTVIARAAYDLLLAEVKKQITLLTRVSHPKYDLCYLVTMEQLDGIPKITYHFSGLNHTLEGWNAWSPVTFDGYNATVCLKFKRSTHALNIIGSQHLQNVNVGYDLRNKVISLQDTICTQD